MYSNPNRYTTPMNLIFWLLTLAALYAILHAAGADLAAIVDLLSTGDFTGGIFGLQEDSPVITGLIEVAHLLGNSVAIY